VSRGVWSVWGADSEGRLELQGNQLRFLPPELQRLTRLKWWVGWSL